MNQKKKPKKTNKAATAAVLCFVAAIAIVGTYTFKDYKKTKQIQELAQVEEQTETNAKQEEKSEQANTSEIQNENPNAAENTESLAAETEDTDEDAEKDLQKNETENADGSSQTTQTLETGAKSTAAQAINFSESDKLLWPINGSVCMNFSMDQTVYFQTLDQYKYNPALIIAGAVGDQVIAGAPGLVKSIDVTAETGTTINIDLGNGYELFYGQLKEVPVKTGDYVEAKTVLGYVSEPTKYYSVEGANVYFEMRKDGQPIDPKEYLVE